MLNLIHTLISWSIDSCQNKVSADQDHMTVSFAQVPTSSRTVFLLSFSLTSFQLSIDRSLKLMFFQLVLKSHMVLR